MVVKRGSPNGCRGSPQRPVGQAAQVFTASINQRSNECTLEEKTSDQFILSFAPPAESRTDESSFPCVRESTGNLKQPGVGKSKHWPLRVFKFSYEVVRHCFMDPDETHEEVRHQEAVLCELWCKSLCLCVCVCHQDWHCKL